MNNWQQKIAYSLFRLLPVNKNKVVTYDSFSDMNLREVRDELSRSYPDVTVVQVTVSATRDKTQLSRRRLPGIYHLATAGAVVTNNHLDVPFSLRAECLYVQLWHACGAIKCFGQQLRSPITQKYLKSIAQERRLLDYAVAPSTNTAPMFSAGFGISEDKILNLGVPATDRLFTTKAVERKAYREQFGIASSDTVILYAPTFREGVDAEEFLRHFNIKKIQQALPADHKLAIRLHRNTRSMLTQVLTQGELDGIIDLSDLDDTAEALILSDVLISDYSALIFDFSILAKPILLFPYDIDRYADPEQDGGRGLNLVPGEGLPFPVAYDDNQLITEINQLSSYSIQDVIQFRNRWFDAQDGRSACRVADLIVRELNK